MSPNVLGLHFWLNVKIAKSLLPADLLPSEADHMELIKVWQHLYKIEITLQDIKTEVNANPLTGGFKAAILSL